MSNKISEAQKRNLEVQIKWNGKANVCIHCGRVPETFYIVTGHDHTDDCFYWCPCREVPDTIESLRQQLAEKDAEIERLKTVPMKYRRMAFNAQLQDENRELEKQLAASQAREAQLREALEDQAHWLRVNQYTDFEIQEALAQPSDTSALEALIAKAGEVMRERAIKAVDLTPYRLVADDRIRALPGVTVGDLKK